MTEEILELQLLQGAPNTIALVPRTTFRIVVALKFRDHNEHIIPSRSIPLRLTLLYENKSMEDKYQAVIDQSILKCSTRSAIGLDGKAELDLRITENSENKKTFEKSEKYGGKKVSANHQNQKFVIKIDVAEYSNLNPAFHTIVPICTSPIYVLARDKKSRTNAAIKPRSSTITEVPKIDDMNVILKERSVSEGQIPTLGSWVHNKRPFGSIVPDVNDKLLTRQARETLVCSPIDHPCCNAYLPYLQEEMLRLKRLRFDIGALLTEVDETVMRIESALCALPTQSPHRSPETTPHTSHPLPPQVSQQHIGHYCDPRLRVYFTNGLPPPSANEEFVLDADMEDVMGEEVDRDIEVPFDEWTDPGLLSEYPWG